MKQVGHQRAFGPSRDAQDAVLDHSSPLGGTKCPWASQPLPAGGMGSHSSAGIL